VEYKLFRIGVDALMNSSKNRQYRNKIVLQLRKVLATQPRNPKVLITQKPNRYGDVFSQMTRNDAQLQREDAFGMGFQGSIEREMSKVKYSVLRGLLSIATSLNSTVGIVTLLLLSIVVGYGMLTLNGSISMHTVLTPVMLVGFLFTNINCGNFTSKKRGEAPWLLLANGITQKTESIDQPSGSDEASEAIRREAAGLPVFVLQTKGGQFSKHDYRWLWECNYRWE
jgi:hypothetical protein